jgi:hypothetical protein
MNQLAQIYETDFTAWTDQTVQLLKHRNFTEIDLEHLIEELEGVGHSNRDELVSRFVILIAHLLKWQFQLEQLSNLYGHFAGGSWRATINLQRLEIRRKVKRNPSLKNFMKEAVEEAYPDAIDLAHKDTNLPISTFPNTCPYSIEQITDDSFFPES